MAASREQSPQEASQARTLSHYGRHVVSIPGLLSLFRVPAAVAFVAFEAHPVLRLFVLLLAGVSDVLDGWYARRTKQATPTGAVLDPITDKLFVLTVAATLVIETKLGIQDVLLVGARELGEAPLVLWLLLSPSARQAQAESAVANWAGKAVTVLQFVAIGLALFQNHAARPVILLTAGTGVFAAAVYWKRTLAMRAQAQK